MRQKRPPQCDPCEAGSIDDMRIWTCGLLDHAPAIGTTQSEREFGCLAKSCRQLVQNDLIARAVLLEVLLPFRPN